MEEIKIGDNIIKYRKQQNISQKELAKKVGMTPQSLLRIEKNMVTPKSDTLEKIMKALNITPNQLYDRDIETTKFNLQTPFARNFKRIRESEQISISDIAKKSHSTEETIKDIEQGKLIPKDSLMKKLASILNTSVDNLTANDLVVRGVKEVELLEYIEHIKFQIKEIRNLEQFGEDIEVKNIDDEGRVLTRIYSIDEQIKDKIISNLVSLPVKELTEVYKIAMLRKIEALIEIEK